MTIMHIGLSYFSKKMIYNSDKLASINNKDAGLNYLYEKMTKDHSFEIAVKSYPIKMFLALIMPNPSYFDRYEKLSIKN